VLNRIGLFVSLLMGFYFEKKYYLLKSIVVVALREPVAIKSMVF
jgi:hypothetical protein